MPHRVLNGLDYLLPLTFYSASLAADSLCNGLELSRHPIAADELDERIKVLVAQIYSESKATAKEFNCRGDLHAGATIAGFLRVADILVSHGAV